MRLTSFVVWKSWASNPLRTALTVLGIALGVAIVVAIYVMDHNTIQSRMREQRLDRGPVDLEVSDKQHSGRAVAEIVADLRGRERVRDVVAWAEGAAALVRRGEAVGGAQVFGLSPFPGERFGHYRVVAGADLRAEDEVLLGEELAKTTGLSPGDRITVQPPPRVPRVICKNGVPVVQPRSGAFPELVEATGGGLLFDPADPGALAAALDKLIADQALRRELGRRGRAGVKKHYSLAAMAEDLTGLYGEVAPRR